MAIKQKHKFDGIGQALDLLRNTHRFVLGEGVKASDELSCVRQASIELLDEEQIKTRLVTIGI